MAQPQLLENQESIPITSGVGVLRVVLEVLHFLSLLLVQGFGQSVEEF